MNEKHLILAVLAFERQLITLTQLTTVCGVWSRDRTVTVSELLEQRGWVSGETLAGLEQQFQQQLLLEEADSHPTLTGFVDTNVTDLFDAMRAAELLETGNNKSVGTLPHEGPELLAAAENIATMSMTAASRYTWMTEVGKGGLGKVWLALDNDLAREVALKEIKSDSASQQAVRRLIREAQITAQLQHPNIVPVYEVHRGERPYYTMKLVRGKTLAEAIQLHHEQRRAGREDPLSKPRLMTIYTSICNALAYAHSRGIIHRDLKPQNIVLGDFGEAIVLDWGLARPLERSAHGASDAEMHDAHRQSPHLAPVSLTDDAQTDATQNGSALGTPAYMAPEQAEGRNDLMDARTDVYGLGAILFEIVTGQPPHRLPDAIDQRASQLSLKSEEPSANKTLPTNQLYRLLVQISSGETPHVRDLNPGIPVELDAICARAMAKDRADRYQSANDLKAALSEFRIHEKSIELTTAASADLALAKTSNHYADFNRALYGFEEALRQWPENVRAAEGEREATVAFAKTAYARGDFDLAVSLLNSDIGEQKALRATIQHAAKDRANHHIRIKYLRRFSLAVSLLVAVIASIAAVWVNDERLRAVLAREDAKVAQIDEARQRGVAERARLVAIHQTKVAVHERLLAAQQLFRANQKSAEARWGLYIASLRLAASQLENNAIGFCNQTLSTGRPRDGEPDLRGWEWNYLWNQTHSELLTVTGHTAAVETVGFSPNGLQVVSGSADLTVRIWETLTGNNLQTLKGHTGWIRGVQFSPDGQRVVSCSNDKTVRVWDASTGQELLTLNGHPATVTSVAYSFDGQRIVSGSDDNTIKVWDAETGKEQLTLTGHLSSVMSVNFSPDGQQIVSGSDDQTAKIWDAQTGQELRVLTGHFAPVLSVSFSPDGQSVVSGSWHGLVKIWDSKTGELRQTCIAHTARVRSVVFTPSGQRIVSASDDNTIKVWDPMTGKELFTLRGHIDDVACVQVSQDEKRFVSGSFDRTVKLWNAQTGQQWISLSGHSGPVQSVSFSRDNRHVVSGGIDLTVKVWDIHAGEVVMTLTGHSGPVQSVAFSPDGLLIISAGGPPQQPGELFLWNAQTGELILKYEGHSDVVNCVAFSPDGRHLLSGSADRTLKQWDVSAGQLIRTMSGHSGSVTSIDFGPKGKHFVSGSQDKTLKVWDFQTGQETQTLRGHSEMVRTVSFSPDAVRVVSGGGAGRRPGELKVWDIETGRETLSLQGHADAITSVNFSLDGKRILSASQEGRIKIWEAKSGQELLALNGHAGGVTSATFCQDDHHILSGGQDGTLRIWDGRPESEFAIRAIECEARIALGLLRPKFADRDKLIAALRQDPTLTPAALKLAVEWINALQE